MTLRLGLTGGIASGKSTVSRMFADLGAIIIDSDVLAREVVAPGTEGLAEVVAAFGEDVLTDAGEMDRAKVGAIVFADPEKRKVLEQVIHPRVFMRALEIDQAAGEHDVVINDIPLLVETDQADRFDAVVVVDVPRELQVERMVRDRGMTVEEATARIGAQATREQRLAVATYVIENTGTLEDLRRQVGQVWAQLQRGA
ncbi:dephospho-CoA kinase [Nocardioides jiangxiensis]|uniref:Dephospho-CoA kinase n=1 Tax=Nocardioides jiangxiensis TaxID=3064524 RepID=A0ABT9B805_9ACTN|nr:dephospho-CoA kinase [Nocardioides sp. WY-20]MDO7869416.1 dephospho-CoA kinase [Nocardioides sp. WY-20]